LLLYPAFLVHTGIFHSKYPSREGREKSQVGRRGEGMGSHLTLSSILIKHMESLRNFTVLLVLNMFLQILRMCGIYPGRDFKIYFKTKAV
jgi:hypothetical protein